MGESRELASGIRPIAAGTSHFMRFPSIGGAFRLASCQFRLPVGLDAQHAARAVATDIRTAEGPIALAGFVCAETYDTVAMRRLALSNSPNARASACRDTPT